MTYTSHASKGKYNPIKVPDESRKIIERGNQVLRAMEIAQKSELDRALTWLGDKKQVQVDEANNLKTNFNIEEKGNEIRHRHKQNNFQVAAESARVEGENAQRMITAIAGFSKTATDIMFQQQEDQKKRDFEKGFLEGTIGRIGIDEQVGAMRADHQMETAAEGRMTSADYTESLGRDKRMVEGMRSGVSQSYKNGLDKAKAISASNDWPTWFAQQNATNREQMIELIDEETGKRYQKPLAEIQSYKETAQAQAQMLIPFLKSRGLDPETTNPAYIASALQAIGNHNSTILTGISNKEIASQQQYRNDVSQEAFDENPSREQFVKSYTQMRHNLGDKKARDQLLDHLFNAKDNAGNAKYTKDQIENITQGVILPGQNKTLGDQYEGDIATYWGERRTETIKTHNLNQREKSMAEDKEVDKAISVFEELMERPGNELDNADVEKYLDELNTSGASAQNIAKVSRFLKFTNEYENDEQVEEEWASQAAVGALTKEDILTNVNASQKLKGKYLKEIGDYKTTAAQKPKLDAIKAAIESRGEFSFGKKKNWTIPIAVDRAQQEFKKDVVQYMKGGKSEQDAIGAAFKDFRTEFKEHTGDGKTNLTGKGGKYEFESNKGYLKEHRGYKGSQETKQREWYSAMESSKGTAWKNEDMLDENRLIAKTRSAKETGVYTIGEDAKYIATLAGPKISSIDVTVAQMKRYGMDVPKQLQQAEHTQGKVNQEVLDLVTSYQSAQRTAVALQVSSGETTLRGPRTMRAGLNHIAYQGNEETYIDFGNFLQGLGLTVGGHPKFTAGGTNFHDGKYHSPQGYHPHGEGMDITHQTGDYDRSIEITRRVEQVMVDRGLAKQVIGPGSGDPNHTTHLDIGGLTRIPDEEDRRAIADAVRMV